MDVKIISANIKDVIVEDLFEKDLDQGNLPKKLAQSQLEKFINTLQILETEEERFYPHLKFTIQYANGEKLEVLTEGKRAKIGEKLYAVNQWVIDEEYPFVKLANYHEKINIEFQILEMKRNNPTVKWMNHFVLINDGYVFTLKGLIKSDEAFNQFIMGLFNEIDYEITKEKAYSFVKELYTFFNKLVDDELMTIDTEDREDICRYVENVLMVLGLYDEDLSYESYGWKNW